MSPNHHRKSDDTALCLQSIDWVINPSGDVAIASGQTIELSVTVSNRGEKSAIFDIYLDDSAELVRSWCSEPFQRLALDAQQSAEAVFRISIPIQTLPDDYEYLLILDSPRHYPEETPRKHQARFRVLPPVQSVEQAKDPTFFILPTTRPDQPQLVRPSQPVEWQIVVSNRSERVDRFQLTCADLPETWYRIIYPEGRQDLGQVIDQESLLLNPGSQGRILLLLNLPANIKAGHYQPTLHLRSNNNPNLVLMDVAYLQVDPIFDLSLSVQDILGRVETSAGVFHLTLTNGSNIPRALEIAAEEISENSICTYDLAQEALILAPSATEQIELRVLPTRRWQRPWWGQGRAIPFAVTLNDTFDLPVESDRVESELIWLARPLWQRLLLLVVILSGIATIGLLVWSVLFRPPAHLQITNFSSENAGYSEAQEDFIHLQWKIGPPKAIRSVQLSGISTSGAQNPATVTYDFSQGIPITLQDICTTDRRWLTCRFVRTDARVPGDYQFDIKVFPHYKKEAIKTQQTETISITPLPDPQIVQFAGELLPWTRRNPTTSAGGPFIADATQPSRQPAIAQSLLPGLFDAFPSAQGLPINATLPSEQVLVLNWELANPQQLEQLTLTGRTQDGTRTMPALTWSFTEGLPDALKPFCQLTSHRLLCSQLPATVQPGDYEFTLAATYDITEQNPVGTQLQATAEPLQLLAPAMPKVLTFTTDQFSYRANETDAIHLSWSISHPKRIQTLRTIGRSPDGRVSFLPISFNFDRGIPASLQPYCQSTSAQLTCQGVPVDLIAPGQYQFELAVIPQGSDQQPVDIVQSERIDIEPTQPIFSPPEIVSFQIDGHNALPKHTVELDPEDSSQSIDLSWQVTGGEGLQVMLLPSPGTVPAEASLTYPLTPRATDETLTLQVSDAEGNQIQRSVIISTLFAEGE